MKNHPERGFGLAEIIIIGAVGTVLLAGLIAGLNFMTKSVRKLNTSLDVAAVRTRIMEDVSCEQTFGTGATPPCADGSFVPLKNRAGNTIVGPNGTMIGDLTVLALCTSSGLDIRAAALTASAPAAARWFSTTPPSVAPNPNWFRADEVNNRLPYNWYHPRAKLFAGSSSSPCSSLWNAPGSKVCPASNQAVVGINADGTLACKTLTTKCRINIGAGQVGASFADCAADEFLAGGGAFCGDVPNMLPGRPYATAFLNRPVQAPADIFNFTNSIPNLWAADCALPLGTVDTANDWSTAFAICRKSELR